MLYRVLFDEPEDLGEEIDIRLSDLRLIDIPVTWRDKLRLTKVQDVTFECEHAIITLRRYKGYLRIGYQYTGGVGELVQWYRIEE